MLKIVFVQQHFGWIPALIKILNLIEIHSLILKMKQADVWTGFRFTLQVMNIVQSSGKSCSVRRLKILRQNALVLLETVRYFSDHRTVSASTLNKNTRFLYLETFTRSQYFKILLIINML